MKRIVSLLLGFAISIPCFSFSVNAETYTDSADDIRIVEIDLSDDDFTEITLTEGEQVQLVFPGSSDLDNKRYIHYYSGEKKQQFLRT